MLDVVLRFIALLRRSGFPISTGQTLDAVRALSSIDMRRRDDVYVALRTVLLDAHAHEALFFGLFERFWRGVSLQEGDYAPGGEEPEGAEPPLSRRPVVSPSSRLSSSIAGLVVEGEDRGESLGKGTSDPLSYSARGDVRRKDFATLTGEEEEEVRRLLRGLDVPIPLRRLRRSICALSGEKIDRRRLLRRSMRQGGELVTLPRRTPMTMPRTLVLICDISGSMEEYTRYFLLFMHGLMRRQVSVETFVFSTTLIRITRHLKVRDPERALFEVADRARDVAGGTRIGEALSSFNRRWAQRVLEGGAIVCIISDGWDRGDPARVAAEMAHLQRSCRALLWLNPLLGVGGYQPLTRGMAAALPFIDHFLPAHTAASLEGIAHLFARLKEGSPIAARRGSSIRTG